MRTISILGKYMLVLALFMMVQQSGWVEAGDARNELEGIRVHWRSNNKSAEQLALAIEKLYVVLYNTGNLPTREIVDQERRC